MSSCGACLEQSKWLRQRHLSCHPYLYKYLWPIDGICAFPAFQINRKPFDDAPGFSKVCCVTHWNWSVQFCIERKSFTLISIESDRSSISRSVNPFKREFPLRWRNSFLIRRWNLSLIIVVSTITSRLENEAHRCSSWAVVEMFLAKYWINYEETYQGSFFSGSSTLQFDPSRSEIP